MIFQQLFTFGTSGVLFYIFHVSRPTIHRRNRIFALSYPVEVLTVAARPFPRISEIKNRFHATFTNFGHKEIKSIENVIVVHTRFQLQSGLHFGWNSVFAVGANQYTQVDDAIGIHKIKFAYQPVAIATLPC
ncbi:hypothetical protein SDC9_141800 [bioreactor metagenome]|uniref:Uncharacterized protein n=1 Tax=bioreactor metagenome TaxID=1076179 RepID=A0A645E241_9ZZZZ